MISGLSNRATEIRQTKVFIWDEASMVSWKTLDTVDRTLKDLMKNDRPFGGKILIMGGDFRQILPVVRKGTRQDGINECLFFSNSWQRFQLLRLSGNMRAGTSDDQQHFRQWLLDVGEDNIPKDDNEQIQLPEQCLLLSKEEMIQKVFGDDIHRGLSQQTLLDCAILAPTNKRTLEINSSILAQLPHGEKIYKSIDSITSAEQITQENFPTEYLNSLTLPGLPLHDLALKKDAVIMLLRNYDVRRGLCNGSRLRVLDMGRKLLRCLILTGTSKGQQVLLPRINNIYEGPEVPFEMKRVQFPVRLCFAMTINKSQGQTFKKVGVDLTEPVFSHGQLYVACSRVGSLQSLCFITGQESEPQTTANVVYNEVFQFMQQHG
jgi:ATP-dependent DNA helicase PIF1